MNELPKRSKASISKQTNQHILKAFNKIKEITHGDKMQVRKVQNCRSCGGCFFGKF
jgi:CRISPR/Cas system-associated exonuclease Cas4 (RecB family)